MGVYVDAAPDILRRTKRGVREIRTSRVFLK